MEKPSEPDEIGLTFNDQNSILDHNFHSFRDNESRFGFNTTQKVDYSKFTTQKGRKVNHEELKLSKGKIFCKNFSP